MFHRRRIHALLILAAVSRCCLEAARKLLIAPANPASSQTERRVGIGAEPCDRDRNSHTTTDRRNDQSPPGRSSFRRIASQSSVPFTKGRIVRLYAGQGSSVKKGQKLADLESADIDQAEADYLKALADYENARRTSAAEVKLAQATYDRTKMLYEKTITAGKNLQAAEHDLEVAKAAAASSVAVDESGAHGRPPSFADTRSERVRH